MSPIKPSIGAPPAPSPALQEQALPPLRFTAVGLISALGDMSVGYPLGAIKGWQQNDRSARQILQDPWKNLPAPRAAAANVRSLYAGFAPMYLGYGSAIAGVFFQKPIYETQLRNAGASNEAAYAGAWIASAAVTSVVWTAPLEGLMVKVQLARSQGAPISAFEAIRRARATEGLSSLWRGATPQAVRTVGFVLSVGAADALRGHLSAHPWPQEHPHWTSLAASGVCGVAGALLTNPADLIKTRMQQFSGPTSVIEAMRALHADGAKVALRGCGIRALGFIWGAEAYAWGIKTFTPLFRPDNLESDDVG